MHIFIQNRFFILVWQIKLVDFLKSQFYTSVNLLWQYCCTYIVLLITCDTYLELTMLRWMLTLGHIHNLQCTHKEPWTGNSQRCPQGHLPVKQFCQVFYNQRNFLFNKLFFSVHNLKQIDSTSWTCLYYIEKHQQF